MDPILITALALAAGPGLALAPWPTAVTAVACIAVLQWRRSTGRATIALVIAALLVGGLRSRAAIVRAAELHETVRARLSPPARCEAEAVVVGSPAFVTERRAPDTRDDDDDEKTGDHRVDVELSHGLCGDQPIGSPLRARLHAMPTRLARGDLLRVIADVAAVHLFANEGQRSPLARIARGTIAASGSAVHVEVIRRAQSPAAWIDRARNHVRDRITATYHPSAGALARALVLGETDLDPADNDAFRASGLAHLLAVSGTHLVIAVVGFTSAVRALLVRIGPIAARFDVGRIAAAIAIPAAWLYADFAGGGGSAFRAAAMLTAAMLARALGRRPSAARALAWTIAITAALDPVVACDISFGLSAAATAGLLAFEPTIARALPRGPTKLRMAVAATLAAMIGCLPLLATISETVPLLGLLANVVAAPIGEMAALPICLIHTLLWWLPDAERGAATLGSGALLAVRSIARLAAAYGGVRIPPPTDAQLGAIAVLTIGAWTATTGRARKTVLAAGAAVVTLLEVVAIRHGAPRGTLRVSVLDVGQGDATLIDFPDGRAMLIDGGGFVGTPIDTGERVILPFLRARRRSHVDFLVLSHPHPDHFGGLGSTTARVSVGEFWDTGQGEDQGALSGYDELVRGLRARGVPVVRPHALCDEGRVVGGARIEVLAPCPGYDPDASANDNSFVLRIAWGQFAALLVGDAERHEEQLLLRTPHRLRADFLKVGHHGSRTSSSVEFLQAVNPRVSTISSGVRNRFGHPHRNALDALRTSGTTIIRTDQGGAFVWETDGTAVRMSQELHAFANRNGAL